MWSWILGLILFTMASGHSMFAGPNHLVDDTDDLFRWTEQEPNFGGASIYEG